MRSQFPIPPSLGLAASPARAAREGAAPDEAGSRPSIARRLPLPGASSSWKSAQREPKCRARARRPRRCRRRPRLGPARTPPGCDGDAARRARRGAPPQAGRAEGRARHGARAHSAAGPRARSAPGCRAGANASSSAAGATRAAASAVRDVPRGRVRGNAATDPRGGEGGRRGDAAAFGRGFVEFRACTGTSTRSRSTLRPSRCSRTWRRARAGSSGWAR